METGTEIDASRVLRRLEEGAFRAAVDALGKFAIPTMNATEDPTRQRTANATRHSVFAALNRSVMRL